MAILLKIKEYYYFSDLDLNLICLFYVQLSYPLDYPAKREIQIKTSTSVYLRAVNDNHTLQAKAVVLQESKHLVK